MALRYLIPMIVIYLLTACRPIEPINTKTPTLPSPTVTLTIQQVVPTKTPIRPTQSPPPDPLDIASQVLTELEIDITSQYSPDNPWEVKRILAYPVTEVSQLKYDNQYYKYFKITCWAPACSPETGLEHILVNKWTVWGMGYSIPATLGWSGDEKFFYFFDIIIPDGCQPLGGFQENLRRVDLQSGSVEPILLKVIGGLNLSPDSRYASFYDQEGMEIGIYDLINHAEKRIPFELPPEVEYWYAGDFTWSPNGNSFLFRIQYGDPCFPTGTSIRRVDLQGNRMHTLLDEDEHLYSIIEWSDPDRILLAGEGGTQWQLDRFTGELTGIDEE
jgi:hypothetical protein